MNKSGATVIEGNKRYCTVRARNKKRLMRKEKVIKEESIDYAPYSSTGPPRPSPVHARAWALAYIQNKEHAQYSNDSDRMADKEELVGAGG